MFQSNQADASKQSEAVPNVMVVPCRIPALVLCLATCGYILTGSHQAVAFTTAAAFRTPRHHTGVEAQQQRTWRLRTRPSSTRRRRPSPSAGSVRLSAAEGEEKEGDDAAGVYIATEVREQAPAAAIAYRVHM